MKRFFITIGKKLSFLLRSIDLYGRKTELTMNHEDTFKTNIGGFFSLIVAILSAVLFFNFGSDMLYYQNPSVVFSEIYSKSPERESFSKENYFFMFGVQDSSFAHYIDETIYSVSVSNNKLSKKNANDSFFHEVQLERCTEDHLPSNPDLHEYFLLASGSPLNTLFCLKDIDQNYIEGSFDSDIFAYLEIKVNVCVNKTDDPSVPICKPIEEIKKRLGGTFAFYTIDYLVDPQNFESPGQPIGKDYFTPISVGMTRTTVRFITSAIMNSDNGFLFETSETHKYPAYVNDKETLLFDSLNQGMLVDFVIRKHHSNFVYERSYKKFQDVLAEIGGFIQMIYLIFWVATYPFISKKYYEKIVNLVYNFESQNKESRIFSCQNEFKLSNFSDSFPDDRKIKINTRTTSKPTNPKNNFLQQKDAFMKYMLKIKKKPPLRLSYCEYLKELICLKRNNKTNENASKLKRLMRGKNLLEDKLDIGYLMKKFYEIDKLKMLLLNENQFHLFEYLPKPIILKNLNIDLGQTNLISLGDESDTFTKTKKIYTAYQNLMKQNELSNIDKKILDMLDEKVKNMLKVGNNSFFEGSPQKKQEVNEAFQYR